jgi:uncharacterized protein (DUF2235 family)
MKRRLIICADGTWNSSDGAKKAKAITNVVKMARAILPVTPDDTSQIVFYHEGVGTHWGLDRFLGGALGLGISENICSCYRWLVHNYHDGDEIFLFGFSRGAYTVRSLAGLIRNCGLLKTGYEDLIPQAYALYRDRARHAHPGSEATKKFRAENGREVKIKCIGVWDTVGSLGLPLAGFNLITRGRYQFHDVTLSSWVENAFHALAIDERRRPFAPSLWECQGFPEQRVEQVWFAGVHSNVGGGYVEPELSDITFVWMADRAAECGLVVDPEYIARAIRRIDLAKDTVVVHNSLTPFYYLLRPLDRTIMQPRMRDGKPVDTRESVHESAYQLVDRIVKHANKPYGPRNLPKKPPVKAPDSPLGRSSMDSVKIPQSELRR